MTESDLKGRWSRWRERVRQRRITDIAYRIMVGLVGLAVLGLGILAIPYPGPGWIIVFLGLGILASEFERARRVLKYVKKRYDAVMEWFGRQGWWVKALGVLGTTAVVVGTLWLLGTFAWAAGLVGIEWDWLSSPIGLGS